MEYTTTLPSLDGLPEGFKATYYLRMPGQTPLTINFPAGSVWNMLSQSQLVAYKQVAFIVFRMKEQKYWLFIGD